MPRNLSENAVKEINALETGEAFLFLLTITHDSGVIRVVNNNEDVISNGQIFTAYAFEVTLASQDSDSPPLATISFDNVDRMLVDVIRSAAAAPMCNLDLVLSSAPNIIEMSVPDLALRDITYGADKISGTLYVGDILNQRYPADTMTPSSYGGLF